MDPKQGKTRLKPITRIAPLQLILIAVTVIGVVLLSLNLFIKPPVKLNPPVVVKAIPATGDKWKIPNENTIPAGKQGEAIRYGRELLIHTSQYFGPHGSVAPISNGMNCQNCHLEAGGKLFGNNYAGFIAGYPKKGARSGKIEAPADRIVQCFERSLAGQSPDTTGREVKAMLAYMKWIGQGVKAGQKLYGAASGKLPFLDHAANPAKGRLVYTAKCQSCHGTDGAGIIAADGVAYTFPALWGKHSYNDGAGMYRIGNLAAFVKNNMPLGTTYQSPKLTDEEAWDVAAYVNSQPRPHRNQHADWPDLKLKPVDAPFGPYIDRFTENQHKYGPFNPIKNAQKELTNKKS